MNVVGHDNVGKDQNAVACASFVVSLAENLFELVGSEDWESVVCYGSEIDRRRFARDDEHRNWRHSRERV